MQKPYLNLGCGKIQLPCLERPVHHGLIDAALYHYPLWLNVDKVAQPGIDEVIDIFAYPWKWADNSFNGALLSHLVEHVPHEINSQDSRLKGMQDGWFAFFSELYRVLTDGAIVHILSPYGWSQGAITDPTHTRLITEHTFSHSMIPVDNGVFQYDTGGIHFAIESPPRFGITEMFEHLVNRQDLLTYALQTQINVAYDIAIQLRVVKNGESSL